MITGYVLISVDVGKERKVYQHLKEIPGISELHVLFGEYDILVRIEAEDANTLGEFVINKIRTIDGVTTTRTLLVVPFT